MLPNLAKLAKITTMKIKLKDNNKHPSLQEVKTWLQDTIAFHSAANSKSCFFKNLLL